MALYEQDNPNYDWSQFMYSLAPEPFRRWFESEESGRAATWRERFGGSSWPDLWRGWRLQQTQEDLLREAFVAFDRSPISFDLPPSFDNVQASAGTITFRGGTQYWSQSQVHSIQSSYIRGIARKRWDLIDPVATTLKGKPDFPVEIVNPAWCGQRGRRPIGCQGYMVEHKVPEKVVFDYCVDVLGMTTRVPDPPKVVEKEVVVIQEKIVEVTPGLTLEKRAILQAALTRELHVTNETLAQAHVWNDGKRALECVTRLESIRELLADFSLEPHPPGEPGWLMVKKEPEDPQMEMFDAM